MTVAEQIARWADELRDMAALGIRYAPTIYDRERYDRLQSLSIAMQAYAGGQLPEELEPLRSTVFLHPTPFSVADAAVIDTAGRMLLIQRADNQCWAMPGGALEVGETPAQGAVREAFEETGVAVRPVALVGVYDSRLCGASSRHHLYMFVFLCHPTDQPVTTASHAHESLASGWYTEAELPANIDPGHRTRIPHAFAAWRGAHVAYFDQAV